MAIQIASHCDDLLVEIEYVVATTTTYQALWLHRVFGDLQQGQEVPILS